MATTSRRSVLILGGVVGLCCACLAILGILGSTSRFEGPRIREAWRSSGVDFSDTDSLAVCRVDGGEVRLFATAKEGQRIDCFNALTGEFIRSYGKEGLGKGEFLRPNGIATCDFAVPNGDATTTRPAVFVVERDGVRVQAFWADTFEYAGEFDDKLFRRPYGVAIHQTPDEALLFVTDARGAFERRVHVFELAFEDGLFNGRRIRSFGEKEGDGIIVTPESIAIDSAFGHVLVCDEDATQMNVKVYTVDGSFTGVTFGRGQITREAEGIAIYGSKEDGFVILTDQRKDATVWHLFERGSYEFIASFTGSPNVSNTDGIAVLSDAAGTFDNGALFAVNDDRDVRAYSMKYVLKLVRAARGTPEVLIARDNNPRATNALD